MVNSIEFDKTGKDEYELIIQVNKIKIIVPGNHGQFRHLIQKIDSKL